MFGWFRRKTDQATQSLEPVLTQLVERLDSLDRLPRDLIGVINQQSPSPPELPADQGDLIARVDSLELRLEQLHKECLRHLQMGSQRLKQAERKEAALEELDEDERPPVLPEQLQLPTGNGAEDEDNFAFARRMLREQGIMPIG